jgi:hypothetical protein
MYEPNIWLHECHHHTSLINTKELAALVVHLYFSIKNNPNTSQCSSKGYTYRLYYVLQTACGASQDEAPTCPVREASLQEKTAHAAHIQTAQWHRQQFHNPFVILLFFFLLHRGRVILTAVRSVSLINIRKDEEPHSSSHDHSQHPAHHKGGLPAMYQESGQRHGAQDKT